MPHLQQHSRKKQSWRQGWLFWARQAAAARQPPPATRSICSARRLLRPLRLICSIFCVAGAPQLEAPAETLIAKQAASPVHVAQHGLAAVIRCSPTTCTTPLQFSSLARITPGTALPSRAATAQARPLPSPPVDTHERARCSGPEAQCLCGTLCESGTEQGNTPNGACLAAGVVCMAPAAGGDRPPSLTQ